MIIATPLVAPFAKALGLSVGMLGMGKATDLVNKYIQENPEQSKKIISAIMPAQGIASVFEKRGIGDNNPPSPIEEEKPPQQEPPEGPNLGTEIADIIATEAVKKLADRRKEKSLTTQNFLDDDLMDQLLVMRGGIKGFQENMSGDFPKMPASTKDKMEMELQKKLFDKYKINEYPEGESPETVNEFRKKYLEDTYFKNLGAIEYITSVAYDVIGRKDKDSILVVDEDGLPIAGAKISIPGTSQVNTSDIYHRDSVVIQEAGSIFKDAGDQLFNDIIKKAKEEGKRFVVAEDLTSPEALEAMKKRGFRTTTTKDTKKFKGKKIRRPNGRSAVQKNLVLDLGAPEKKSFGGLIDKPLPGRSRDI